MIQMTEGKFCFSARRCVKSGYGTHGKPAFCINVDANENHLACFEPTEECRAEANRSYLNWCRERGIPPTM